jgi:hypothetical protein
MTRSSDKSTPSQWRWDRFDAKQVMSLAWASHSCVGKDCYLLSTHQAMQRRVIQDKKGATHIILGELPGLFHEAANITGMTYRCKLTGHALPCINSKDIRLAWMQDGSEENMQKLAWMFYYYGREMHKMGRSCSTHGERVEQKVMTLLNVSYVHLGELPINQCTCVQQSY